MYNKIFNTNYLIELNEAKKKSDVFKMKEVKDALALYNFVIIKSYDGISILFLLNDVTYDASVIQKLMSEITIHKIMNISREGEM